MVQKQLKRFTSIAEITFQDVWNVLDKWEKGEASTESIFAFAEDLYDLGPGWPDYPRNDQRSVLFAVLESLEMIYTQPTLPSDISALKEFLVVGKTHPLDAWALIDEYWANTDWNSRLKSSGTSG